MAEEKLDEKAALKKVAKGAGDLEERGLPGVAEGASDVLQCAFAIRSNPSRAALNGQPSAAVPHGHCYFPANSRSPPR